MMPRDQREKLSAHCLELAAALDRGETPAFEGIPAKLPRDPAKIRKFARNILWEGARESELIARHLLLHQELIPTATPEQMAALVDYIEHRVWESMREHDPMMFGMLDRAVKKYETKPY